MYNTHAKHAKHAAPRRRAGKGVLILLLVLFCILALLAGVVAVLYFQGRSSFFHREDVTLQPPESLVESTTDEGDTVQYEGRTYRFNEDVIGILVMGVDKEDIQQDGAYGSNGQADTLLMAAVDTVTGEVNIIPISRETMVEVDQYTEGGSLVGSQVMQLCLAYAYTDNSTESCENVCRSVSRLLYGAPVDSYIAIDMQGLEVITDTLGGVTVNTLEQIDYTRGNVYLKQGINVNLTGKQAIGYIRYRGNDTDANNRRMQRQKQFFNAFVQKATQLLRADVTKLGSYYATVQPYVVSDLTLSQVTYLASTCLLNRSQLGIRFLSIDGRTVDGPQYVEFYPDTQSVYEAVLAAFYEEVSE